MKCKEIMTEDPVCCLPDDEVAKAAQLMKDEDVGVIPIIEDEETKTLLGIVTDRDLAFIFAIRSVRARRFATPVELTSEYLRYSATLR